MIINHLVSFHSVLSWAEVHESKKGVYTVQKKLSFNWAYDMAPTIQIYLTVGSVPRFFSLVPLLRKAGHYR